MYVLDHDHAEYTVLPFVETEHFHPSKDSELGFGAEPAVLRSSSGLGLCFQAQALTTDGFLNSC